MASPSNQYRTTEKFFRIYEPALIDAIGSPETCCLQHETLAASTLAVNLNFALKSFMLNSNWNMMLYANALQFQRAYTFVLKHEPLKSLSSVICKRKTRHCNLPRKNAFIATVNEDSFADKETVDLKLDSSNRELYKAIVLCMHYGVITTPVTMFGLHQAFHSEFIVSIQPTNVELLRLEDRLILL